MNQTEEAVRQLFTTATEDVPPGLDLMRGVRARGRKRARVALSAGLAAIVTAATVITLSAVRAPSALAQVTQAATRTASQSYRVTSTRTLLRAAGAPGTNFRPVTIIGEFDPARDIGEETIAGGTQVRYVGTYIYIPVSGAFLRADAGKLPGGKSWVKLLAPDRSGAAVTPAEVALLGVGGVQPLNPQDLLGLLKSASQVRETGPASGPGWTGTAYTFTVVVPTGGPQHLVLSARGTVDVDQQGRVRRLDTVESVGQTVNKVRLSFGDFGIHVSVSAPPPGETVTP